MSMQSHEPFGFSYRSSIGYWINGKDYDYIKEHFERRYKMKENYTELLNTYLVPEYRSTAKNVWDGTSATFTYNKPNENVETNTYKSHVKKSKKSPKKKKSYFDRESLKVTDFYCNRSVGLNIKQVVFNDPATIVLWKDGSKTVVKCKDGDIFDTEVGLAMCFMKRIFGEEFHHVMKTYAHSNEPLNSLTPQKAD